VVDQRSVGLLQIVTGLRARQKSLVWTVRSSLVSDLQEWQGRQMTVEMKSVGYDVI